MIQASSILSSSLEKNYTITEVALCNILFFLSPFRGIFIDRFSACFSVSQLQQTLSSIQELLTQQQQRIQELSQELSTAKVE